MKKLITLAAAVVLLSACSHEVALTYNCVPSGATIYQRNIGEIGQCPATVKYNTDDINVHNGKVYIDQTKVTWASGATLFVEPTFIDIASDDNAMITFMRPEGHVHYQGDDSIIADENYSKAYDAKLPPPTVRYYVTAGQRHGFFDGFNHGVTCLYDGVIADPYTVCD